MNKEYLLYYIIIYHRVSTRLQDTVEGEEKNDQKRYLIS